MKDKARNDVIMNRGEPPYNMEAFVQEAELGGGPPFFKGRHFYIDLAPAELKVLWTRRPRMRRWRKSTARPTM